MAHLDDITEPTIRPRMPSTMPGSTVITHRNAPPAHELPPFLLSGRDKPQTLAQTPAFRALGDFPPHGTPGADVTHGVLDNGKVRAFESGATRSSSAGRYDPEGFMSPIVIERFCEYMQANRLQPDGSIRDSDNWQKGIPLATYVKGMWRHVLHLWTRHRGYKVQDPMATAGVEEDLCAIIFNANGMLFEILKEQRK